MGEKPTKNKKRTKRGKKMNQHSKWINEAPKVKQEIDKVVEDLKKQGIDINSHITQNVIGLGDVVESTLKKFGITEERFKYWFNLSECGCKERQKWLNGLFSWKVKN